MNGYDILIVRLRTWQRWFRLHQGILWGLRASLAGTLAIVIGTFFAITSDSLQAATYIRFLLLGALIGLTLGLLAAWLRPLFLLGTARRYEQQFSLKERISTAIELHTDETISPSWHELQLADALDASAKLSPRTGFDWRIPRREIVASLALLIIIAGTWFYGQGSFERAQVNAQNQALIDAQMAELTEIIAEIEKNEDLSEVGREQLIAPLQESLEDLEQADTLEEAVSILAEAQRNMKEAGSAGERVSQSLQEAGERLLAMQEEESSPFGESMKSGDFGGAAEALGEMDTSEMDAQATQALANELAQAAQALQEDAPELSQAMQEAAEALQNEDMQAAQEAMQQASEQMQDAAQQAELSQASEQSAQSLESSREELREAANQESPSGEMAQQQGDTEQSDGQSSGSSSEGEGEATPSEGMAEINPIERTDEPDEAAQTESDSVYAPQRLEGEGTSSTLDPSGESGDSALGETTSQFDQSGQSLVPYQEVFGQYETSAWQSLQSGTVPLALRPLVRDYFSSLNP